MFITATGDGGFIVQVPWPHIYAPGEPKRFADPILPVRREFCDGYQPASAGSAALLYLRSIILSFDFK